jgi:hypothetical protein
MASWFARESSANSTLNTAGDSLHVTEPPTAGRQPSAEVASVLDWTGKAGRNLRSKEKSSAARGLLGRLVLWSSCSMNVSISLRSSASWMGFWMHPSGPYTLLHFPAQRQHFLFQLESALFVEYIGWFLGEIKSGGVCGPGRRPFQRRCRFRV